MTLTDQLAAARRELTLRRSAYPGWVRANKITKEKADHEIAAMTAIVATLEKVQILDEAGLAWVVESERKEGKT